MATDTAVQGSALDGGVKSILTGLGTPLVMLLLLVWGRRKRLEGLLGATEVSHERASGCVGS